MKILVRQITLTHNCGHFSVHIPLSLSIRHLLWFSLRFRVVFDLINDPQPPLQRIRFGSQRDVVAIRDDEAHTTPDRHYPDKGRRKATR